MGTRSLALVDSRFHTQKNLHLAEWTAQLVIGVRALRHLVNEGAVGMDGHSSGPPALAANDSDVVEWRRLAP
jgi:hypothetical protein